MVPLEAFAPPEVTPLLEEPLAELVAIGVVVVLAEEPLLEFDPLPEAEPLPEPMPDALDGCSTTPVTLPTGWPFWPFTWALTSVESRTNCCVFEPVLGMLPVVPVPPVEPVPAFGVPVVTAVPVVLAAGVPVVLTAGVPVVEPAAPPVVAVPVVPAAGVPVVTPGTPPAALVGTAVPLLLLAPPPQAARSMAPTIKNVKAKLIFFIQILRSPFENTYQVNIFLFNR